MIVDVGEEEQHESGMEKEEGEGEGGGEEKSGIGTFGGGAVEAGVGGG